MILLEFNDAEQENDSRVMLKAFFPEAKIVTSIPENADEAPELFVQVRVIRQEMAYKETGESYSTEIKIFANNRTGLLVDISRILTENKIDVTSMNCRTSKQGTATISMSFDIKGLEQLRHLVEKLRNVEGVLDIERTNS